jgi:hypothetical protein
MNLINDKHHNQRRDLLACRRVWNQDKGEDTDEWASGNGYVSVVPVQFDLTAHHHYGMVNKVYGFTGFLWLFGFITLFTPIFYNWLAYEISDRGLLQLF